MLLSSVYLGFFGITFLAIEAHVSLYAAQPTV